MAPPKKKIPTGPARSDSGIPNQDPPRDPVPQPIELPIPEPPPNPKKERDPCPDVTASGDTLEDLAAQHQLQPDLLLRAMVSTWESWDPDTQQQVLRQAHAYQVAYLLQAQTQALESIERLL